MGETVVELIQVDRLDLIIDALIAKYGWDRSVFKQITAADIAAGKKSFKVVDHNQSGIVNPNEIELYQVDKTKAPTAKTKNPIICKVDRKDIVDQYGNRAVFSGLGIAQTPDGFFELVTDRHNTDIHDKAIFVDEKMVREVEKYAVNTKCEEQISQIPDNDIIIVDQFPEGIGNDEIERTVKVRKRFLRNGTMTLK